MQTGGQAFTRKGFRGRKKRWIFTNGSIAYQPKRILGNNSLGCCMMTTSSTLQKKLYPRRSIFNLLSDKGEQFVVCERYRVLGLVCQSKGEAEKAINHFETALGIASSFN